MWWLTPKNQISTLKAEEDYIDFQGRIGYINELQASYKVKACLKTIKLNQISNSTEQSSKEQKLLLRPGQVTQLMWKEPSTTINSVSFHCTTRPITGVGEENQKQSSSRKPVVRKQAKTIPLPNWPVLACILIFQSQLQSHSTLQNAHRNELGQSSHMSLHKGKS